MRINIIILMFDCSQKQIHVIICFHVAEAFTFFYRVLSFKKIICNKFSTVYGEYFFFLTKTDSIGMKIFNNLCKSILKNKAHLNVDH